MMTNWSKIRHSRLGGELIIFLVLALLVIVVRLPGLNVPFDNDSGAIAYHARLINQSEPLYGTHHTGHHLPAAYYLYATAFALFGDQVSAVKGVLIMWTIATVYLLYLLGCRVANRRVGFMAAIFAAILSGHPLLAGHYSKIESFILLPQTAAILSALYLGQNRSADGKFLLPGLFIGLSFLGKPNYLFAPGLVTGLIILLDWWPQRRSVTAWRQFGARGLAVLAGFFLPLALVYFYFQQIGLAGEFLATFRYGTGYVNLDEIRLASPVALVIFPLYRLTLTNALLAGLGLAALGIIGWHTGRRWRNHQPPEPIFFIAVWFLAGFVETGSSRLLLYYYYLIFVPALAILSAWMIERMAVKLSTRGVQRVAYLMAIGLVILFSGGTHFRFMVEYGRYIWGAQTHAEFLSAGLPPRDAQQIGTLAALAEYLDQQTTAGNTIYYWSNNVALYYYAGRRAAVRNIWPYYAQTGNPAGQIFSADTFIVDRIGLVPIGYADHPDWLWAGLEANYTLETVIDGQQIYRHK